MSIESVKPSNHLIFCHPLLKHSIFFSITVLSNNLVLCIRWPKYWSFSLSIGPSNKYSGSVSLRIDRFDLLAVRWTLKSLQHHNSKASILWLSTFLMVQLSTTVHDHWEDHGLDYMDFYRQHDVSASQVKLVVKSPSVSTGEIKELILKLKLQYFGHLMQTANSLEKTLMVVKIEGRRRRGRQRMKRLDGIADSMDHEFEPAQGDSEGQRSLVCCSSWVCKEVDMT